MKLWTLQPLEVLNQIETTGRFICDETKSCHLKDEPFIVAYNWLVSKMEEKIGSKPFDVKYPIWAWHSWNWKNKKPDLRRNEFHYGEKGSHWVCIELEIPTKEVVLSDEPSWTCYILNQDYFNSEMDENNWEIKEFWFDNLSLEEKEEIRIKSWDNVFDITPCQTPFTSKGKYIQATFWELKKEYIKKITHFTC